MRIDIRIVSNKIHANKFCNLKQLHVKFHKFHGLANPSVKKEKPRSDNENPLFIYFFLINENFFIPPRLICNGSVLIQPCIRQLFVAKNWISERRHLSFNKLNIPIHFVILFQDQTRELKFFHPALNSLPDFFLFIYDLIYFLAYLFLFTISQSSNSRRVIFT